MFNLDYKNWLIPYVDGVLDQQRTAILEDRLKKDASLALELETVRRITGQIRHSASGEFLHGDIVDGRRSLWPRIEASMDLRRPTSVFMPRFAMAGGAAVLLVGAIYWTAFDYHAPGPNPVQTATATTPSNSTPASPPPSSTGFQFPVTVHHNPVVALTPRASLAFSRGTHAPHPVAYDPLRMVAKNDAVRDETNGLSPSMVFLSPPSVPRADAPPPPPSNLTPPSTANNQTAMTNNNDTPSNDNDAPPKDVTETGFQTGVLREADIPNAGFGAGPFSFMVPSAAENNAPGISVVQTAPSGGDDVGLRPAVPMIRPKVMVSSVPLSLPETVDVERNDALDQLNANDKADAIDDWRDALEVAVNSSDQDVSTSELVDGTLTVCNENQCLDDLTAEMEDEAQQPNADVAVWRILGHIYMTEGRVDKAVMAWTHVTETGIAVGEDWYQLGRADELDGKVGDAIDAYNKVIDLDKNDSDQASRTLDASNRLKVLSH